MSAYRVRSGPVFFGKTVSEGFSFSDNIPVFARAGRFCIDLLLLSFLVMFHAEIPDGESLIHVAWAEGPPLLGRIPGTELDRPALTLDQAVRIALDRSPKLAKARARIARERARSVEIGELPDPKLVLGEQYFPIPLNTGASVLTMTTLGLRQSFSPWGKRALLQRGSLREETASIQALEDQKSLLVRDVRLSWLDLYREARTEALLQSLGSLWIKAFQSALIRYRQGIGPESDVLLAQFQKDDLRDKQETLRTQEEKSLHRLMRLMRSSRPFRISLEDPVLPEPLPEAVLLNRLDTHPAIQFRTSKDAAQALRVQSAEKDKIPAFSVEGDYNYFMGPSFITSTPNLFSVVLTMNLPVRPGERQNQKVAEEEHALEALEAQREALRQKLIEEVRNAETGYHHLEIRETLLDRTLLPETKRNEAAVLSEYSTGTIDLGPVLVAMKGVEEVELRALSLRTDRLKTMAELSYLAGTLQGGPHDDKP